MKFRIPNLRGLLTNQHSDRERTEQCFNQSKEGTKTSNNNNRETSQGNDQRSANRDRYGDSRTNDGQRSVPRCSENDINRDLGNAPYAFDIENATNSNSDYRAALWTGKHLQLTVMSIPVGGETGIEMHNNLDQFINIKSGAGRVNMGRLKSNMNYSVPLDSRYAILIPEGTYHNIINTGRTPLKLYSLYAPKAHPFGTVDSTKEDSAKREKN